MRHIAWIEGFLARATRFGMAMVAVLALTTAATAQSAGGNEPQSNWPVTCSDTAQGAFVCQMTQRLVDAQARRVLMVLSISGTPAAGGRALIFQVGHGAYLPAGLKVSVDGGTVTPVDFARSTAQGLVAALPLNDGLIGDMRRGSTLAITIELNRDQPVTLDASLKGFSKAFDRISGS